VLRQGARTSCCGQVSTGLWRKVEKLSKELRSAALRRRGQVQPTVKRTGVKPGRHKRASATVAAPARRRPPYVRRFESAMMGPHMRNWRVSATAAAGCASDRRRKSDAPRPPA
jgi:hypothetical protein